ncbi:30S ribosomal protein S16 [Pseudothermotoga sp.]|nr:30S ribosomal protein S16 [Pseudothermotoga sp.]MCX7813128.1 30S ribosomal protein S16 [Pseudothermotoga sp.]MDW8140196.1 30S ribosomal protein S16 [Pseudothermotoga sp.]
MVRIRLTRLGKRNMPFYRIVVVDSRKKRDGAYIESLGYYNPLRAPADIKVNVERAVEWILKGAQPSDTVRDILSRAGVLKKVHEIKYGKREATNETSS